MSFDLDKYIKEREAHDRESAISDGYTIDENEVRCPYCGRININDEGQFCSGSVGNREEYECQKCDKVFLSEWNIVYSTQTLEHNKR